jgi:cytochrome P450
LVSIPITSPASFPALNVRRFGDDPIGYIRDLYREYGPVGALHGGHFMMYFGFGPEYNQHILSRPEVFYANLFTLPGPKNSALRRLGLGLISMNGEQHKRHRRLLLPSFHRKTVEAHHDTIVTAAERMLRRWRPHQVKDVLLEARQLVLDIMSQLIFGFDQPELVYELGRLNEESLELNTRLGMSGMLPVDGGSDTYQELLALTVRQERLLLKLIEQKRAVGCRGEDVLSILVRAHDEDGSLLTDAELVGQATILFGAANRTTAGSLTWTLFLLSQHPAVAAALLNELEDVLHGAPPTPAQLSHLPLLDRALKESLRLLPPVSFNLRKTAAPAELGPYTLPKGATVLFSHYLTHHLPELFPQPERFLPERWLTQSPSPYAYLPFSAGARMCIGAGMATVVLKTALAMIVQRYRLTVVPGARIDRQVTVTLDSRQGMPMLVAAQDGDFRASPVVGNIHEMVELEADPRPQRLSA